MDIAIIMMMRIVRPYTVCLAYGATYYPYTCDGEYGSEASYIDDPDGSTVASGSGIDCANDDDELTACSTTCSASVLSWRRSHARADDEPNADDFGCADAPAKLRADASAINHGYANTSTDNLYANHQRQHWERRELRRLEENFRRFE